MYPGNTIGVPFAIKDGYGQLRDADSTPVVVCLRNGIDTTVSITVSKTATGLYAASLALPTNWVNGDLVDVRITATVQGFTDVRIAHMGHVQATAATAEAIRQEIERADGMLEKTLKTAKKVRIQTL